MEKNALLDIKRNLKNFEINKKIIDERLKYIKFFLKLKNNFKDRLGPVLPIPIEKFKNMKKLKKIFLIDIIQTNYLKLPISRSIFYSHYTLK